ncbi:MAG: hypothetical protein Q9M15_00040 [Mariprofundaceae bacterium]|nr:hypothetical protein [Mariprofundaceae bacterium]
MTDIKVQDAMDQFLDSLCKHEHEAFQQQDVEACFEMLAEFLVYYSNLFPDQEEPEDISLDDWEEALEGYVEKLFEGDMERTPDLGGLSLMTLDAEYFRDFLGWYVLREPSASSVMVKTFSKVLQAWALFMRQHNFLNDVQKTELCAVLDEVAISAGDAATAAHLLLYYVRLGAGVAPRLRGKRFDAFVEGHARIERLDMNQNTVFLGFDNQDAPVVPIVLPLEIMNYLHPGDVLDVEMGQRGGQWIMVDIGPVYPSCIYMEADELKVPDKLT